MSFLEERFDVRISMGGRGGPNFSTTKAYVPGGARLANKNWTYPLHRYDISQAVKTNAQFERVRAWFYNVAGAFDGFRYKDWSDYKATLAAANGTLSLITGAVYQLERLYSTSSRTFRRPIYKPVSGTVTVYRNGIAIAPAIDYTTGRVTVSGHTGGDVYTWAGEFDVPVAFVNDNMDAELVDKRAGDGEWLLSWGSIELEEIRV